MKKIHLPKNDNPMEILSTNNFVLLGANGSGKSKLGAWIEFCQSNGPVLRVSAQRALSIPNEIIIKSEEAAWNQIFYGDEHNLNKGCKWEWSQALTTKLVNDYQSVLAAIFARYHKENEDYIAENKELQRQGKPKKDIPMGIIDNIITIWDEVFPHRQISFKDTKILVQPLNSDQYHAKNMSDGERVAIYLIGQCLVAPDNTVIVIDEPEIHLHKAIMMKLWDNIEQFCPNKTFVYITHDLDFAASRKDATKVWVKSFYKERGKDFWDWELIPSNEEIPDSLLFEVLGNRKPILFVEGERGSYDNQLYPYIYDQYHVIPCHNCAKVIEMTKAFNNAKIKSLHNLDVKGLIDRDYMTPQEVESYKSNKVYTLEVAEVENLYLVEELIKLVARHQMKEPEEIEETFEKVKHFLFENFKSEYNNQLISICTREIEFQLRNYKKPRNNDVKALRQNLSNLVDSINVEEIYKKNKSRIDQMIETEDYSMLLRIYNRKSLHERVSEILGLAPREYPKFIQRFLKSEQRNEVFEILRQYTPQLG